jgi:hypothetical protein
VEIGESWFKASPGKKVSETLSQRTHQAWWHILTVPATQEEAGEGRSQSEATLGKSTRACLKNKLKQKGVRV